MKVIIFFLFLFFVSMININEKNIALVFDLDYTLWPFWVDTHVSPPFKKGSDGIITDRYGYKIEPYPEVMEILEKLKERGYIICSISRTQTPREGRELLELTGIDKYLKHIIFDTGNKISGIKTIIKKEGLRGFKYCALFDDESRNINDANRNDVFAIRVDDSIGVTKNLVNKNLREMHKNLGINYKDI